MSASLPSNAPGRSRLTGSFSDIARATKIAATFRRAKPFHLSPASTGRFDARAFYDPQEHKWRVTARYLPADTPVLQ